MLNTASLESHNVLTAARLQFEKLGRIPYDTAVRLMQRGYIVPVLEDMWARAQVWRGA